MNFLCPLSSAYICNCYVAPARLFIFREDGILSNKGTTQDDPASMRPYLLGILPMFHSLLDFVLTNKLRKRSCFC